MLVRVNGSAHERTANSATFVEWSGLTREFQTQIFASALRGNSTTFQFTGHQEVQRLFSDGGLFSKGGVMKEVTAIRPVFEVTCTKEPLAPECEAEFHLKVKGYDASRNGARENAKEFAYPATEGELAIFMSTHYTPRDGWVTTN